MAGVDYIAYFRSLVERDPAAEHWNDWWNAHGAEMATLIPHGMYLRLTAPLGETKYRAVFAVLEAAGYSYPRPKNYRHAKFWEPNPIPAAWLTEKTTMDELEKKIGNLSIVREYIRPG